MKIFDLKEKKKVSDITLQSTVESIEVLDDKRLIISFSDKKVQIFHDLES